jgi:hypothetical protein
MHPHLLPGWMPLCLPSGGVHSIAASAREVRMIHSIRALLFACAKSMARDHPSRSHPHDLMQCVRTIGLSTTDEFRRHLVAQILT